MAIEYTGTDPLEIVNYMDLEEGHVLTQREADAIHDILQDAVALRSIREGLGIQDED